MSREYTEALQGEGEPRSVHAMDAAASRLDELSSEVTAAKLDIVELDAAVERQSRFSAETARSLSECEGRMRVEMGDVDDKIGELRREVVILRAMVCIVAVIVGALAWIVVANII